MHILVLLLIVAALLYWYFTTTGSGRADDRADAVPATPPGGAIGLGDYGLAFISRGKLFYVDGQAGVKELHSPYVQDVVDRMERARQRKGWKKGTAFETSFVGEHSNLPSEQMEIKATTAQFTPAGRMLYFLRDDQVGGLFEYDFETGSEARLIHQQQLLLNDLSLDPGGERLVCTKQSENGTANIGIMAADGSDYRDLTGGDTLDSAPTWVAGESGRIVYQSSGVARNEAGYVVAIGPASIQMLDIGDGELTSIRENDGFDYLQPKVSPTGDLHFIRRPYEPPRYSGGNFLLDFILFPFRLLRALFHYLNFFSLMYTREPLTSASGPKVQADLKELLVKGKRIDAEKALQKESRVNGVRSLVPKSWQLVRRSRDGQEQVLATNVAAYDIADDGALLFTNGYGVFLLDDNEGPRVVLRDKLIAELVAR